MDICRRCGRTKKDHEVPPFEYALLLAEQQRCLGFDPKTFDQEKKTALRAFAEIPRVAD